MNQIDAIHAHAMGIKLEDEPAPEPRRLAIAALDCAERLRLVNLERSKAELELRVAVLHEALGRQRTELDEAQEQLVVQRAEAKAASRRRGADAMVSFFAALGIALFWILPVVFHHWL